MEFVKLKEAHYKPASLVFPSGLTREREREREREQDLKAYLETDLCTCSGPVH